MLVCALSWSEGDDESGGLGMLASRRDVYVKETAPPSYLAIFHRHLFSLVEVAVGFNGLRFVHYEYVRELVPAEVEFFPVPYAMRSSTRLTARTGMHPLGSGPQGLVR